MGRGEESSQSDPTRWWGEEKGREEEEKRKRKIKEEGEKREEGKGQVTWMDQPRNGEKREDEGRSGSLSSHLLHWDVVSVLSDYLTYHTIVFLT
ncbi:hypothetical protein ASPBRDRAFT_41882 [Aspergillus brasiliensis CBS 101740]|uniref:Uncharacterized protein n=1 Tax=Aspergillus brasiliensis (strain CBS 101740 / IMI 381727 / IBT 21946) TaxID=767769 RepID=A0A1L9UQP0_ASPBC|nr:hypothetical protein ASPBRDRAFT_41882 [Aspergillus brasiliensis CBS 101740]